MAMSDNASILYEAGQTFHEREAMTSVTGKEFNASFKPFSVFEGKEVKIMPYGVVNGGEISGTENADELVIGQTLLSLALSPLADANGNLSVSSQTVTLSRPETGDHLIYSIVVNEAGEVSAIAGNEGTAFSNSRGADGGAPYIPEDAVELGQVKLNSQAAAPIVDSEIFQIANIHKEMADAPIYTIKEIHGKIEFADALPPIHEGGKFKKVAVEGYTPLFAEVPKGYDFVPAEISHSVSSQQVYGATVGATSKSIGQASFSAILNDGITDDIIKGAVNKKIWVKFKQNRNRLPYALTLGVLGISRTFPADNNVTASFTLSAESETVNFDM